jgi:putative transcriptional regulator
MMEDSLLKVAHSTAKGLYKIGLIDTMTMHEFDAACLPSMQKFTPNKIKKLRTGLKVSQPVLAKLLNISPSTVQKWERGEKHPSGAALKLLNLVADKGLAALI